MNLIKNIVCDHCSAFGSLWFTGTTSKKKITLGAGDKGVARVVGVLSILDLLGEVCENPTYVNGVNEILTKTLKSISCIIAFSKINLKYKSNLSDLSK